MTTTNVEVATNEPLTQPEVVPKEQLTALEKKFTDLEASHKSLQRTLHNERQRGGNNRNLEQKLEANEKLLVGVVDVLGKMGVEGVDTKALLAEHQQTSKVSQEADRSKEAASAAIVGAFEAAGIPSEEFESVWLTDERFATARDAFSTGKYTDAITATVKGFTVKQDVKSTLTPEKVQEMIDAAVAKDRQARASSVPATRESISGGTNITYDEWKKLPQKERAKHDYKQALRKNG